MVLTNDQKNRLLVLVLAKQRDDPEYIYNLLFASEPERLAEFNALAMREALTVREQLSMLDAVRTRNEEILTTDATLLDSIAVLKAE